MKKWWRISYKEIKKALDQGIRIIEVKVSKNVIFSINLKEIRDLNKQYEDDFFEIKEQVALEKTIKPLEEQPVSNK